MQKQEQGGQRDESMRKREQPYLIAFLGEACAR
jgi:hypothetical protein